MSSTGPLLSLRNLDVVYQTDRGPLQALRDVSLDIEEGRALGLAGESGSGKSTIALALLDLLGPGASLAGGTILFEGRDLLAMPPAERRALRGDKISIVFQDPFTALNPALNVGLQVAEPLIFHQGLKRSEALKKAVELLAAVGLPRPEAIARAYPHQLSGGMQQRALIATALACDPRLLILDEPTTALDVTIEAQILDLLEDLRKVRRLTILFISHNLGVVGRLCDEVCILYGGRILEHGRTEDVFGHPAHPYTQGLLASLPRLDHLDQKRLISIPGRLPDLTDPPPGCIFGPRCPGALDRCGRESPPLEDLPGRRVRCWSPGRLSIIPAEEPAAPPAACPQPESLILKVTDLRKEFRLGGLLSSLRIVRRPKGGTRLAWDPIRIKAVDKVSLAIAPGEVLGLVGESGCGKSTLGRCLIRLIEPTGGRVVLDGRDLSRLSHNELTPLRRQAQIIFQNPDSSLNPRKTVGRIIGRPLTRFGLAQGRALEARVVELLDLVHLSPAYADRYPHQLSGGEKQRVGIARALATNPRFIICDEAVSALDVSVQAAVVNLLADLRDRLGLAYLFISHDLSVVAHLSNRIAVMYRGAICETGAAAEVLKPPFHPYTEALLSAVPRLGARESQRIRLRGDAAAFEPVPAGCRFHSRCPRRLGRICETEAPPSVEVSPGHFITCHLASGQAL
ncbi:MAG: ABC transporter ATP-binding protein [Thermodesulfobacteriota bacterium]